MKNRAWVMSAWSKSHYEEITQDSTHIRRAFIVRVRLNHFHKLTYHIARRVYSSTFPLSVHDTNSISARTLHWMIEKTFSILMSRFLVYIFAVMPLRSFGSLVVSQYHHLQKEVELQMYVYSWLVSKTMYQMISWRFVSKILKESSLLCRRYPQ